MDKKESLHEAAVVSMRIAKDTEIRELQQMLDGHTAGISASLCTFLRMDVPCDPTCVLAMSLSTDTALMSCGNIVGLSCANRLETISLYRSANRLRVRMRIKLSILEGTVRAMHTAVIDTVSLKFVCIAYAYMWAYVQKY